MNDYALRQQTLHTVYTEAYRQWIENMTPDQRARALQLGVASPITHTDHVNGRNPGEDRDPADTPAASYLPDIAAQIDTQAEQLAEQLDIPLPLATLLSAWHQQQLAKTVASNEASIIQRVVGGLLSAKNVKVEAAGLAFAAGLDTLNGLGSQREYAIKINVSHGTVSKCAKKWQRDLELHPSSHMKSLIACSAYSEAQLNSHWRNSHTK